MMITMMTTIATTAIATAIATMIALTGRSTKQEKSSENLFGPQINADHYGKNGVSTRIFITMGGS